MEKSIINVFENLRVTLEGELKGRSVLGSMINNNKGKSIYGAVVKGFNSLARGDIPDNLECLTSKAHRLFLDGFVPSYWPDADFTKEILMDLRAYAKLLARRKKVEIEGGDREITIETEALESLVLAEKIAKDLLLPVFRKETGFSNKIFKDICNLSLSYVDAIANGVGAEYIEKKDAFDAKQRAICLAQEGIRFVDVYREKGFEEKDVLSINRFTKALENTQPEYMRAYENVPTGQKKVYKKKKLMRNLTARVTIQSNDDLLFKPDVIFPVAHGGTEVGVRIANAYEDLGHFPIVYPLLYSAKTKKHRYPWVQHDAKFLGENLNGKNFLVTEDWVTTGTTLVGILAKLQNVSPKEIRVATMKRDPDNSCIPDLERYTFYVGAFSKYLGDKS